MIVIRPKTIRLRDTDWDDLRYLVFVSGKTEGAVVRTLLAVVAQTLRTQALTVRAELADDPDWWGNGGAGIGPDEQRLWAAWLTARQHEARGASAFSADGTRR